MRWLCFVFLTVAHLTSRHAFGIFIEVVNVGAERLEVRDDKLLPEGLGEQNDVALDTSRAGDHPKHPCLCCGSGSGWLRSGLVAPAHTSNQPLREKRLSQQICSTATNASNPRSMGSLPSKHATVLRPRACSINKPRERM